VAHPAHHRLDYVSCTRVQAAGAPRPPSLRVHGRRGPRVVTPGPLLGPNPACSSLALLRCPPPSTLKRARRGSTSSGAPSTSTPTNTAGPGPRTGCRPGARSCRTSRRPCWRRSERGAGRESVRAPPRRMFELLRTMVSADEQPSYGILGHAPLTCAGGAPSPYTLVMLIGRAVLARPRLGARATPQARSCRVWATSLRPPTP
jgi:hypothetical protein